MTFIGLVFLAVFKIKIIQRIHDAANALLSATVPPLNITPWKVAFEFHDKEKLPSQML